MVETLKIDGYTFHRYPEAKQSSDRHYFKGWVNNVKISLHRYIWQKTNGEIPKGFTVHHIDGNFDNNVIGNYELKKRGVHTSEHYKNFCQEYKDYKTKILIEKAQPEAVKWHGSPDGIKWHKDHAKYLINDYEVVIMCRECGKEFKSYLKRIPFYCSLRCKNRYNAREYRKKPKFANA